MTGFGFGKGPPLTDEQRAVHDIRADETMALHARIAELEAALKEVHRRTGLLMTQNQGRWNMSLEHDRRTADVLSVNQDISSAALKETGDE